MVVWKYSLFHKNIFQFDNLSIWNLMQFLSEIGICPPVAHLNQTFLFYVILLTLSYSGADPEILKRGGALCRPTKNILGFRWSKKAKITLETIDFWQNISISIFKFSPFLYTMKACQWSLILPMNITQTNFLYWKNVHIWRLIKVNYKRSL